MSILFKEECFQIQGAVYDVYHEMGCGFLESVYQECLAKELQRRSIPHTAHQPLKLFYKGEPLQQIYIPDFVCHESVIVEIKAIATTTPEHKAQVFNYLRASGKKLGLLVNFGSHPKVSIERIVL